MSTKGIYKIQGMMICTSQSTDFGPRPKFEICKVTVFVRGRF